MNPTNDPALKSWLESANAPGCDFPIQNLPYGVFTRNGDQTRGGPRLGVAIGDQILDLKETVETKLLNGISPEAACALCAASLNDLMKLGKNTWHAVRVAISKLLREDNATLRDNAALREELLVPMSEATMHLPVKIGDYTDFYASIHHATNVGSMFRPDNPLMPNYKHLPVGYHGRASSVVISGNAIRRPMGQTKADEADLPTFGPCRLLDYEMEMGVFIGPGNPLGTRISMNEAGDHLFGMVILNDWSARDIQKWEYQPLGPFNAKNFASTISPWVVTLEALEPFRIAGPPRTESDPPTLDYLQPAAHFGLDFTVEVWIASKLMREKKQEPMLISRGNFREMYWTIAQMLVHHTSTGCNMQPGDLLGSGTISNDAEESRGSLLERTWRGTQPLKLPDGTERKFLQDGDEVIMRAYAEKKGHARIGFGECRGEILPAK